MCVFSSTSLAVRVDDFDSYPFGSVNQATAHWRAIGDQSLPVIETDPLDAENRVLRVVEGQNTGAYGILSGEAVIPDGATKTLFFRFLTNNTATNTAIGLIDIDVPGTNIWGDFNVFFRVIDGTLQGRNGGVFDPVTTPVAANTWYNLWVVVDNASNTFRLYLNEGDDDATAADQVGGVCAFRKQTANSLHRFITHAWGSLQNQIMFDDVYVMDGADFQNPLSVPDETPFLADINQDRHVDIADMRLLAEAWLEACAAPDWCGRADLDKSGRVDMEDFGRLSQEWASGPMGGLVAWWPLNEGIGLIANDEVGQNNGILYNTEQNDWIVSGSGYVLGLDAEAESDGRGEYLRLPPVVQDDFSISFWLRTNQFAPDGDQWWHGKGLIDATATGIRNDFGITLLRDKAAFGVNGPAAGDMTIQSAAAVNDGYWHHIAATRDSTTGAMNLYVDGVREAGGTGAVGSLAGPSRILVGSMNLVAGKYLRGYFDDIRFYNTVLTREEIALLAQKQYPPVTPKKGVGANSSMLSKIEPLNVCWFYNWGITRPPSPASIDSGLDYVPMVWGSSLTGLNNLGNIGEVHHLLGFNEPDLADQANMTVAAALQRWPQMQAAADARALLLGSPSASHYNRQWIVDFMDAVDAPGSGLRVDFMTVHWYSAPNADLLMDNLAWVRNKWGRDVWLTEFNVARWDGLNTWTQEQTYTFLAEALYRMEKTEWLKRYAIFPWDGTSNASQASPIFEPGTANLTPLGKLYAAWDGDVRSPQKETRYYLNNKASHRRLRFTGESLELGTISFMGDLVQWELAEAGNGRDFLQHKGFGSRLAFNKTANQFFLAESSYTGDDAKWVLMESQHGWYFLNHPASGKRLSRSGENVVMVSQTSSGDSERWRFIKP